MCEYCHKFPHHPRCPMAPDPPVVETCHKCKWEIRVGEDYAKIDGVAYCENCLDDMSLSELIVLCGHEWKTAEYPEDDRYGEDDEY